MTSRFRKQLVKLSHLKNSPTPSSAAQVEARLRKGLDQLLALQSHNASIQHIQARLNVQKEGLIRSLLSTPDGTNNLAERELPPMVINRRISNGSNTFGGMETSAIVASIVQTASKQEGQVLATLQHSLQSGVQEQFPTPAIPFVLTPANSSFADS